MSVTAITPYLFFSGRCQEALDFYERALGATIEMKMRFSDSPDPVPKGMLQSGFENKIMHATIRVGEIRLMCSDSCDDKQKFESFRLALSVSSEKTAHHYFDALAEGGKVDMPLSKTFWSPCYGMVTDKFGLGWMVMVYQDSDVE